VSHISYAGNVAVPPPVGVAPYDPPASGA